MKTSIYEKPQSAKSNTIENTKNGIGISAVPVQKKGAEEELPAQGKFVAQLKGPEEEEPAQGKFVAQLKGPEEEEPAQGKFVAQLKGPEEELPAQGKFMAQLKGLEEEKPLQMKPFQLAAEKELPVQKKKNNTGLPDNLKSGIENLSGLAMDDVKVHYNSAKPAQLNAHAYAQGSDIHLASGQEKHLAHEAWHVVQQKQGRVQPTMQMKGSVAVNDDAGLENEADVMGAKAIQRKEKASANNGGNLKAIHIGEIDLNQNSQKSPKGNTAQMAWKFTHSRELDSVSGRLHVHFLYDDININSLHVTIGNHRNYYSRTWASRAYYTPTGRNAGNWGLPANNLGVAPPALAAIITSNLQAAQDAATTAFHADNAIIALLNVQFPQAVPDITDQSAAGFPKLTH
jgi:hypothetical protein